MSTKTVSICDRCGNMIVEDRTALDVRCGPLLKTNQICFDLCHKCLQEFLSFVNSPVVTDVVTS